jgi:hypothetical protein
MDSKRSNTAFNIGVFLLMVAGNEWLIYPRGESWFAKFVKYDSDTGPFSTYEQAYDFVKLRGQ